MGNGGFLAGFTSGVGQGVKELNQNYMDQQLAKYKAAGKIWESMANDPTYHPTIRQQFAQNAMTVSNPNLFDKNSRAAADEVLKQNPHDAAQKAIEAMQMTGTHMPSYYDTTGTRDPIEFEKQRKSAELNAQLEFMNKQAEMLSKQYGAQPGTSELDKLRTQEELKKRVFGAAIPTFTEKTEPYAAWTGKDGKTGVGATYAHGRWFNPAGEEVSVSGFAPPQMVQSQNPDGSMSWVGIPKVAGPTGVTGTPRILGSQTVSQVDPSTLTTTTSMHRTMTPIPGGHAVNAPPAAPPNGAPSAAVTPPSTVPGAAVMHPEAARQKETYTAGPMGREQQAWTGLAQSHRIADLIKQYPMVGPILGRVVEMGNKIGSSWLLNRAAEMSGIGQKEMADKSYEDALRNLPAAARDIGAPEDAAQAAAELITAMRAMNTAEVAMLSGGGGRGITRMYEMLRPALMNPTQDVGLIRGHMKSVDALFADNIRSIYRDRYGTAKPPLQPDQMQYATDLGVLGRIYGTIPSAAGPPSAKQYKYYRKNPTTGQRWGSDDQNNWFDVKTGQPYTESASPPKQ